MENQTFTELVAEIERSVLQNLKQSIIHDYKLDLMNQQLEVLINEYL